MLSDRQLAELMDMATQDDKESLAAMLSKMGPYEIWYFKGYVTGYAEAVSHMQMAADDAGVEAGGGKALK